MPDVSFFASVLNNAIAMLRTDAVPVFTFAFYHDHESGAVSVCVDTEANSNSQVRSTNRYNTKHFRTEIAGGDLAGASLWQANIGRNLSLGDFAKVNPGEGSVQRTGGKRRIPPVDDPRANGSGGRGSGACAGPCAADLHVLGAE